VIRFLAIDSGERVGWCAGRVWTPTTAAHATYRDCDSLPPAGVELPWLQVDRHGISFLKDSALAIYKAVVLEDRFDVVIFETFILTARGGKTMVGSDLQTAQHVGMVRFCGWLNPRVQLVAQGPAAMRSADKSMRAHPAGAIMQGMIDKLPLSHDSSHDGSAMRHAWTWFFERYV
jgi:hypothetical protein